ncbi:MAG: family 43 glycosylhydrolase, partial [Chloroflexi bacterium]|nr:family 43 glycosylhydrolase [Chloroflexota bacterium]
DGAVYGPGHCSFTRSPDGKTDWIVYHARDFPQDSWSGRSTRTQPVAWKPDGTPDFGHPIPAGVPLHCPR